MPEHNPEGETEERLKQERVRDRVWSSKLKKRRRKDLTIEEVEAIVAAAKEPYMHHKDVSQRFRVPARLVSDLVQESIKKAGKLNTYLEKEKLDERKRMAIEEETAKMLNSNKSIVRAQ